MYLPSRKAAEELGVHANTLRKWADEGTIKYIKTPAGHRKYDISSIINDRSTTKICYCRVSSSKQKDDLEKQIKFMQEQFPEHKIIKDIGSGLNFKRKGLISILEQASEGHVLEVVVAHKDRLARFGVEIIEWIINKNGGKLVFLNDSKLSPQEELTTDLLSILHVFSCRMHGLRKYSSQIKEDKSISKPIAEKDS